MNANVSLQTSLIIRYGRVAFVPRARTGTARKIDLNGYIVLPGLINAHDHLEFNLFPRLGCGPYPNAATWAQDIYKPEEEPIATQLKVPKPLRLWWGGLKNLLSGVTSVAHHNPFEPGNYARQFPVRVLRRFGWAHSLTFCLDVAHCLRRTPSGAPFLIHACEGTDLESWRELGLLDEAKVLRPVTVLVHGVGVQPGDLELLRARGSSIVWCPSSNLFTLGSTISAKVLQSDIPIALGTDSALTAEGDLIDELPLAANYVSLSRLYGMVTYEAAKILRLSSGEGRLQDGGVADLLVVRAKDTSPASHLTELRPELVFVKGRLTLVSEAAAKTLALGELVGFHPIEVKGRGKWLVKANVHALFQTTEQILGVDVRLAGRSIVA